MHTYIPWGDVPPAQLLLGESVDPRPVRMYTCMCVCMYLCMYWEWKIGMWRKMSIHAWSLSGSLIHEHIHIHIHIRKWTYTHTYTYTQMNIYTYIYIYANEHIHREQQVWIVSPCRCCAHNALTLCGGYVLCILKNMSQTHTKNCADSWPFWFLCRSDKSAQMVRDFVENFPTTIPCFEIPKVKASQSSLGNRHKISPGTGGSLSSCSRRKWIICECTKQGSHCLPSWTIQLYLFADALGPRR